MKIHIILGIAAAILFSSYIIHATHKKQLTINQQSNCEPAVTAIKLPTQTNKYHKICIPPQRKKVLYHRRY